MSYQYQGICPQTGQLLSLKRTAAAEAEAVRLMASLPELDEGKMFGVLLSAEGTVLKAFSGQWREQSGWAPSIQTPAPSPVPAQLDQLKRELLELSGDACFEKLAALERNWQRRLADFADQRRAARLRRAELRQSGGGPELDLESQREGTAWRRLQAQSRAELGPLRAIAQGLRSRILEAKRRRRELSARYQKELHQQLDFCLSAGQNWSLASLFPQGPPSGTGECCAPKLLHQAARLGLTATGMAEFWWGPAGSGHLPGRFYAACTERCQPLIGPLLSRLQPLQIVHQDPDLLVVVKPSGVLTVPGRHSWNQDCLWLRLRRRFPSALVVHRLDMETSGLCLFALNAQTQRDLHRLFAQRRILKTYEALLCAEPGRREGVLELALAPDPERPGCYRVDSAGKPCRTEFRQMQGRRYEFRPVTGRSHQIRLHAAHGLAPIAGDGLYGGGPGRLQLHARSLEFEHRGQILRLENAPPF
ncbi:MAG: RluA family pseudouridine synthase [Vulcanimicrobiota bacterium]